jgi:hypothetical protein
MISIPIIFHLWFAIGMISNGRAKAINTDWVKQYKTTMKTDFTNVSDIGIYYRFGKVHFDFTVNPKMSEDEYNQIVKKTKDLVVKETITKLYGDQMNLTVKFDSSTNKVMHRTKNGCSCIRCRVDLLWK